MNISEQKLRKIIRSEIKNSLNEGMFDNMFGFLKPETRLLSQELIDIHVSNFHTAYINFFKLNPSISSEYIDMLQVVSDFEEDLKNAKLSTVPNNLIGTGYAPEEAFKQLIQFKKVRNLRDVINSEGVENNKLYERYEEILLGYLSKNFRR